MFAQTSWASASQPATESQLAELEAATRGSPEVSQQYPPDLTDVRVSTVAPWAIATFNLYLAHGEDDTALGLFRRSPAEAWELVRVNSEFCIGPITNALGLPHEAGKDLGLSDCSRPQRPPKGRVLVARGACSPDVFAYRPHRIGISCDRTLSFRGIRWRTYGGSVAIGKGIARSQGCTPACADGQVRLLPVKVRLSKVVSCEGKRLYTRMHYRLGGYPLPGFLRQDSLRMLATNEYDEPLC